MWLHAEELGIVATVLAALLVIAIRWLVQVGSSRPPPSRPGRGMP